MRRDHVKVQRLARVAQRLVHQARRVVAVLQVGRGLDGLWGESISRAVSYSIACVLSELLQSGVYGQRGRQSDAHIWVW